jgi:hypothetical protein
MATGPMQFGADNNAGPNQPNQTVLRAQNTTQAALVVRNHPPAPTGQLPGSGLHVEGGSFGVTAAADFSQNGVGVRAAAGTGVLGIGHSPVNSGVRGRNSDGGNGVTGVSEQRNGVQGESSSQNASGVYGENLSAGGFGVAGRSNAPGVAPGAPGWGAGVFGHNIAGGWAGIFNGWVLVTGSLSVLGDFFHSGSGLRIDHPHDPENRYLNHAFVESPDMMNVYNGNATTDADGNATVELPGYFEALNRDFRYQLTAIGQFAQAIVTEEVRGNRFRIKTDKPNVMVSWQVTGIRQDAWANAHRTEAEVDKPEGERGKYLTPREHGQPATAGIHHVEVELPGSAETEPDSGQQQGE